MATRGERPTLLLLGAGIEQTLAIREAKELDLRVIACDGNPLAPGLAEADVGVVADINDVSTLVELARQHHVDGVFCHAVEIPQVVSAVAAELGLPGLRPEVAERATNKRERIEWLTQHGIPCARFEVAEHAGELRVMADKVGYPHVMKPVDNAGARGVKRIAGPDELDVAYAEAMEYSQSSTVLLEELLRGHEVSTESVVYRGEIRTFAFADRNYAGSERFFPYFVEDGINFPSALSSQTQEAVVELVERTIEVLGIDFGAAKGDVLVQEGEPRIIEMAARTSGGWFGAGSIPIATGANMLKPLIQMTVGDVPDLGALEHTRCLGCAQRYVIPRETGVLVGVSGVEDALSAPGVEMADMFLPEPGSVVHSATNHAERFGHVICIGSTREEAVSRCEAAVGMIELKLQDVDEP